MAYPRAVRKKGGGWLVALPPEIRRWLRITHRTKVYWHATRQGEGVITLTAERKAGRPDLTRLTRELAGARAEIEALQQRHEFHERSLYAEGFAHGYVQAQARLDMPEGPSAERGHRRRMYRWAFPDAAQLTDPKQVAPRPAPPRPRWNARRRRAKRDEEVGRRVEVAGSVDQHPPPDPSPVPAVTEGGAAASEPRGSRPPTEH